MIAALPVLALALLTFWAGTLPGGASSAGALAAWGALLGMAALGTPRWCDPLALGRAGRLLPAGLVLAAAASWWASPVERAGRVGLILLPSFTLLPAAVARCWEGERGRRLGPRAAAVAVGGVGAWALLQQQLLGSERAALPLGHHNLLAGWIVLVLPVALVPVARPGAWRWMALAAGGLGGAALWASGSRMGLAALAFQAALWVGGGRPGRRRRVAGVMVVALALALLAPRVGEVAAGRDPSARARWVYWAAGLRGIQERPLLGWGPGAVPWTIAAFLRPLPGVNPPAEVVGDLHSLPLHLAYELGGTGLALAAATVLAFLWRRRREAPAARDPHLLQGGLLALAGGALFALATAPLAVLALPGAAAWAAGAVLAAGPRRARLTGPGPPALVGLYLALAAAFLWPLARAHAHYDAARRAGDPAAARLRLSRAMALDPSFPLYRARAAWLEGDPARAARGALRAARGGPGLGVLWLQAGWLGLQSGQGWAAAALEEACRLDPLGGLAPFHLVTAGPGAAGAPRLAASALLAEPRLAAATFWQGREGLLRQTLGEVGGRAGVDAGWREALLRRAPAAAAGPGGEGGRLALELDGEPALAFSLYAFRRRPWPAELAPVPVGARAAAGMDLPPATALAGTAPGAVYPHPCGPVGGGPRRGGIAGAIDSAGPAEKPAENGRKTG